MHPLGAEAKKSMHPDLKDRQQEKRAVSSRSHLNALCTFATPAIHEYYI